MPLLKLFIWNALPSPLQNPTSLHSLTFLVLLTVSGLSSECPIRCLTYDMNCTVANINTFLPTHPHDGKFCEDTNHPQQVWLLPQNPKIQQRSLHSFSKPKSISSKLYHLTGDVFNLSLVGSLLTSALPPPPWEKYNIGLKWDQVTLTGASPLSRVVSALVLTFQAHVGKLKEVAPPPHAFTQSLC